MKVVVAAFNQEKVLLGASVEINCETDGLFAALVLTWPVVPIVGVVVLPVLPVVVQLGLGLGLRLGVRQGGGSQAP